MEPYQPEPVAAKCKWCGEDLKGDAPRCATCKAWRNSDECKVCGEPIPKGGRRCNACSSFQHKLLAYIPFSQTTFALVVAFLTMLTIVLPHVLNFLNRNSDTSFVVAGATTEAITLGVLNTGRSPSVLQSFNLAFGSLPLEPVKLYVLPEDRREGRMYVPPGTTVVRLDVLGIAKGDKTKAEIRELLRADPQVELTMFVKESDDPAAGPVTDLTVPVPASVLAGFIMEAIPDE